MAISPQFEKARFGVFEVDLRSGELRRQGLKIKIHDQSLKVLATLLEHPHEVITREQLSQQLWPTGTFVDAEAGLNSAVMKLRDALGDSAESPRFIETIPRRGYRFIADVTVISAPSVRLVKELEQTHGSNASSENVPTTLRPALNAKNTEKGSASRLASWIKPLVLVALALAVFVGITAWKLRRPKATPFSIAVLPLQNLSTEPASDYFSDGLTDEIIRNLSIIDGLEVKSRTSSFMFKNQRNDIHAIGDRLNANLILEGSVLRSDGRLRVNVQLVRVSDDATVWYGEYDRELKDVFAIQDEISRSIVNELRLKLGKGQRRYNTNLEAYDDYLRAEELLNRTPGSDWQSIAASIPIFQSAIAKDPEFAPAYAGVAMAYDYISTSPRFFSPADAKVKMKEMCQKALHLDPLLAESHACMGQIYSREHEWSLAEGEFRRALELNPNLSSQKQDFALEVLAPVGRVEEAQSELRSALRLDPLSPRAFNTLSIVLMIDGRSDEVLANSRKVLASDPRNGLALQLLARALLQQGKTQEAITTLEQLGLGGESFLGYAYAKAGRPADAERIANEYSQFPWVQAIVYGGLGDKDRAIQGLQRMTASNDPRTATYLEYPELSLIRGDSRVQEIRESLNLPKIAAAR